jgi:uncharacterized membrane protein YkvA (DUF1232 family)
MQEQPENLDSYKDQYTEKKLWRKIARFAQRMGIKTVYTTLLMFFAYKRKETPRWAKSIVVGALGYLISPIDLLPDLTPIIGYTDDLGVLGFGLVTIAAFINEDVKKSARTQLAKWFPNYNEKDLVEVEDRI